MSRIELIKGDCLEEMKKIPDKSIDLILCDLPYGSTACSWDIVIPFEPLWKQYTRIIRDGGIIALFGSEPFSSRLRMSNIDWFKYDWIWEKEQGTGQLLCSKIPLKKHENICVFYKTFSELYDTTEMFNDLKEYMISEKKKSGLSSKEIRELLGSYMASHYFTSKSQFCIPTEAAYKKLQTTGFFARPFVDIQREYDEERMKVNKEINIYNPQMTEGEAYVVNRKNKIEFDPIIGRSFKRTDTINDGKRFPTSILKFNRELANRNHPTQKPVALLEYLIETYTSENMTVLDNCMGSGSTGVACIHTNRNFIGIEKDEHYFDVAKKRIEKEQKLYENGPQLST